MRKMMVFPGQGSQKIGMGKSLYDNFSVAKEVFGEIDDTLGQNLSTLIFSGDSNELTQTQNAQPALMAVSMAVIRVLQKEAGLDLKAEYDCFAGHSLGEYSALCAANVFSLSDTAKLLRIRGNAMAKAVPDGQGAMAAILNLDFDKVHEITRSCHKSDDHFVDIANDNSEGQIVISGHKQAVDEACELAKQAGAKRAILLPVSAPFHSALMAPAADIMAETLEDVTINTADIPIIANISVDMITQPQDIKSALIKQVTGRVRWRETMILAVQKDITHITEIGAGKVLSGLFKRSYKDLLIHNIETPQDIEAHF